MMDSACAARARPAARDTRRRRSRTRSRTRWRGRGRSPLTPQEVSKRAEQPCDVLLARSGSHEPDAPDFSRERTETGADLDPMILQQRAADRRLVHAVGDFHRVERPQPLALRRQQREPESGEPVGKREMVAAMALPPRLQPFFLDAASASCSAKINGAEIVWWYLRSIQYSRSRLTSR